MIHFAKQVNFLSAIFSVLIFSCNNHVEKETGGKVSAMYNINPLVMKNDIPVKISEMIDTFRVVQLESKPNAIVGKISKILVKDDLIFVFDKYAEAIFIFDLQGKLKAKIKKKGRGPDEYNRISDFTINSDSKLIVIADDVSQRLILFNYKGFFLKSITVSGNLFSNIAYGGDNHYLLYNRYQTQEEAERYNIINIDSSGVSKWVSFPYSLEMTHLKFSKANYFTNSNSDLYYSPINENVIYKYSKKSLKPYCYFDFAKFNLIEDDLFNIKPNKIPKKVLTLDRFHENNRTVSFAYYFDSKFPAVYIDKKSKNVVYPHSFQFDRPFLAWGAFIVGVYKDFFISTITAREALDRFEEYKALDNGHTDEEIKKYSEEMFNLSKMSNMDNPVLFFFKFKHF